MSLIQVTRTGNICIPKNFREELGIVAGSKIILSMSQNKLLIEPVATPKPFQSIDEEMKRKKLSFTRKEALIEDFYE